MNILWCFTNICFKKRKRKQRGTIKQSKSKSRCINKNLPEPKQTHNTEQRVFPKQFLSKTRMNTLVRSPAPTYFRSFLLSTSGCNGGPCGGGAAGAPLPPRPSGPLPPLRRRGPSSPQVGAQQDSTCSQGQWKTRGYTDQAAEKCPTHQALLRALSGSTAHGDQTRQEELLQTSLAGKNPHQHGASWNLGLETSSLQFSFQSAAILSKRGQNQSETFRFTHTFTPVHKHRSCHGPMAHDTIPQVGLFLTRTQPQK